ncbi:MAG: hypothetical protein DRJ47_07575 [Thermoprotei archaeon]|nr:MAG: hypothetical protein DRJ47_07575 [Thermoprotei archaeon]
MQGVIKSNRAVNMSEELYNKLVEYFARYYSQPAMYLENLLKKKMEAGLSREEALKEVFNEIFGKEEKIFGEAGKTEKPRKGFLDMLSYVFSTYSSFPSISISYFVKSTTNTITGFIGFMLIIAILIQLEHAGLVGRILSGDLRALLDPRLLEYVNVGVLIGSIVFVIASGIGEALYAATLYPQAETLLTKGRVNFREAVNRGFKHIYILIAAGILLNLPLLLLYPGLMIMLASAMRMFALKYPIEFLRSLMTGLFLIVIGGILFIVLRILAIYLMPAIIIDDLSLGEAFKTSLSTLRKTVGSVLAYAVFFVLIMVLIGLVSQLFSILGAPISNALGFILGAIVIPSMDASLTGVYLQARGRSLELKLFKKSFMDMVWEKLRAGWNKTFHFVTTKTNIAYLTLSLVIIVCGVAVGFSLDKAFLYKVTRLIIVRGRINPFLEKVFPFSLASEIFFNNWQVSIVASLSGILTPLAPISISLLNGIILGFVAARLTPFEFMVTIMPHGIIEIPGIIIAIAAGLKLGYILISDRSKLPESIKEMTYVAVGLAPILLTAAVIESTLTPLLIRIFLKWS